VIVESGSGMSNTSYDAFISYSREDASAAEGFQSALQSFARPWYRRRSFRVFRDISNLAAEPSLWGAVEAALNRSRYLIVLASRAAARSPWVDREIRHWLSSHTSDSLILVRLDGTVRWDLERNDFDWSVSDALSPALKGVYAGEPLFVDLVGSSTFSLRDPLFRRAVGQVAARIRNVELDQILGEHLRRHRQTRLTVGATGLVVLSLAGAAAVAHRQSASESRAKEQQALVASSRRLAAQSREALSQRNARLSLLAGLASLQMAETREAYGAILDALTATRHLVVDIQAVDGPVDAIALAADEQMIITGSHDGSIVFWSLATGKERRRYTRAHAQGVTDIAVSSTGRRAASGGGARGGFVLWDLVRLEPVESVKDGPGFSLAFTRDGKWLLAGGEDGIVSAWDLERRQAAITRGDPRDGTIVDISIDGTRERFATGGLFGVVRIRDRRTLRSIRVIDPDPSTGASVDISSDGRRLLMAGGRGVRLWDLAENEAYGDPFLSASGMVHHARFTGGALGRVALTLGADLYLRSAELERLGFHRHEISSLALDRERGLLATGSRDGRARVWSLHPRNSFVKTFVAPEEGLGTHAVAFSRDGARLAVGASDARVGFLSGRTATRGIIYIVDAATGDLLGPPLAGHSGAIVDLAFSPDGRLASASDDGTIRLWDVDKRTSATVSAGGGSPVLDVAFSPDGRLLAFARAEEPAGVWDIGQNALKWRSEAADVTAVAFSPDGRVLSMGTAGGEVRSWATSSMRTETLLPHSPGRWINGLAFDRHGRQIVALVRGEVHLIDVETGITIPLPALGVDSAVRSVAIGPAFAAFLHTNGRLSLWDLQSQEATADLNRGLDNFFTPLPQQVAVSHDGNRIAANVGGVVLLFDVDRTALESRACAVAGAPLSRAEWASLVQRDYVALCSERADLESEVPVTQGQ
jgi:WD40 repeat protein